MNEINWRINSVADDEKRILVHVDGIITTGYVSSVGNVYLFIGFDRDGDPEFKLYSSDAGYELEWIYLSEIIKSNKEAKAQELCSIMGS